MYVVCATISTVLCTGAREMEMYEKAVLSPTFGQSLFCKRPFQVYAFRYTYVYYMYMYKYIYIYIYI